MIDKFGELMLYVNDVSASAKFWTENLEFIEVGTSIIDDKLISVELLPYKDCDVKVVLFDKAFVEQTSDLAYLATPSLLFSTYNIKETHQKLKDRGVKVSELSDAVGFMNFNFPDNENNYFAFREIERN